MRRNPGFYAKRRYPQSPHDPYAQFDDYEKGEFEDFDNKVNLNQYQGPPTRGKITAVFAFNVRDNQFPSKRDKWLRCQSMAQSGQFTLYWPPSDEVPTTANELVNVEVDGRVAAGQRRRVAVETVVRKLGHFAQSVRDRDTAAEQSRQDQWRSNMRSAIERTGFRPGQDPSTSPMGSSSPRGGGSGGVGSPNISPRFPFAGSPRSTSGSPRMGGPPGSPRPGSAGSSPRPLSSGMPMGSQASMPGSMSSSGRGQPGSPRPGSAGSPRPGSAGSVRPGSRGSPLAGSPGSGNGSGKGSVFRMSR